MGAYLRLSGSGREVRWGWVGAYSRWTLIRGWGLIRINTVTRMSLTIKCLKQTTSRVASTSVLEQSEHKPRSN